MKLNYDKLLSNFALKLDLRRYSVAAAAPADVVPPPLDTKLYVGGYILVGGLYFIKILGYSNWSYRSVVIKFWSAQVNSMRATSSNTLSTLVS